MHRLLLLRHAKSSWDNPGLDDFERPLSARGIRDAPRIGAFIRSHDLTPDQVICSPARRAVETWEGVAPELPDGVSFDFDPELYLASRSTIMDVIRSQPSSVGTLMLVGHNPGTEITGRGLSSNGPAEALARLRAKVPTASLIEVQLPVDRWDEVEWGAGTLGYFVTPSWLAKTGL